jgi:hypothetical protein
MATRNELAAYASAVDGCNVTPYMRQATRPGEGWVSLQRSDRDDSGFGFMDRWAVTVVLPQDLASAEKWIDANADALAAALAQGMVVTALVPATLVLDAGNVPGLVIEGSRER